MVDPNKHPFFNEEPTAPKAIGKILPGFLDGLKGTELANPDRMHPRPINDWYTTIQDLEEAQRDAVETGDGVAIESLEQQITQAWAELRKIQGEHFPGKDDTPQ